MKATNILKEVHGSNTVLKETDIPPKNWINSVTITNLEAVINTIKSEYTCFNIKDIKVNVIREVIDFKIYGICFVPERFKSFKICNGFWSATQFGNFNCKKEITEEFAEEHNMPLAAFTKGLKIEFI